MFFDIDIFVSAEFLYFFEDRKTGGEILYWGFWLQKRIILAWGKFLRNILNNEVGKLLLEFQWEIRMIWRLELNDPEHVTSMLNPQQNLSGY